MTAIRRARQFEDYGILWLEEPLAQDNLEGYAKLSSASRIPIAAGEGESGRFAWRDLIERGGSLPPFSAMPELHAELGALIRLDEVEEERAKVLDVADYWAAQGRGSEDVFDLAIGRLF